jgi:Myristoyl-CoA:protein N-myristoyltransferase, N-terminal domain/Myristoyl-CoA:protein N-myristoyltransferase, C-terminal domain
LKRRHLSADERLLMPLVPLSASAFSPVPVDPATQDTDVHWCSFGDWSGAALDEVHGLLSENYVTAASHDTRIDYPTPLLRWILEWPDVPSTWRLGLRAGSKLIGFVCANPCRLEYRDTVRPAVFVNLLCVHREWRNRRFAPALIDEITRRVVSSGTRVAAYTQSREKSIEPLCAADYYCRPLNVERLRSIGYLDPRLPAPPAAVAGATKNTFVPATKRIDFDAIRSLMEDQQKSACLRQRFGSREIEHMFRQQTLQCGALRLRISTNAGIVNGFHSYFVFQQHIRLEGSKDRVTLRCANLFYNVVEKESLPAMILDAMHCARLHDHCDLLFALPIMNLSPALLAELHFRRTDATVNYYLTNWAYETHPPDQIALQPF